MPIPPTSTSYSTPYLLHAFYRLAILLRGKEWGAGAKRASRAVGSRILEAPATPRTERESLPLVKSTEAHYLRDGARGTGRGGGEGSSLS